MDGETGVVADPDDVGGLDVDVLTDPDGALPSALHADISTPVTSHSPAQT
ncbi:hypothetical protein [Nostocoides sp. HKS02]|nr:hypothetical protein [Tetrasphaera sp. HKS02]QGN57695.1 hypothetical protein GKE56_07180 [Tetrasphaera sp. HKS02]